jgi:hypothetical protein
MRLRSNVVISPGSENTGQHHHEGNDNVMLSVEMATTEQCYHGSKDRSMCLSR